MSRITRRRFLQYSGATGMAVLLSACTTGYDYKPSQGDCNDLVNYFSCHFNADVY